VPRQPAGSPGSPDILHATRADARANPAVRRCRRD
jgi:hypothetical protein